MASKSAAAKQGADWSVRGMKMFQTGDMRAAKDCFANAVKADSQSANHRLCLAVAHKALAEYGAAAERFSEALKIDPTMAAAAEQLSALVAQGLVPANVKFDLFGLRAALRHEAFDRDLIAEAAVFYLARHGTLKGALEHGRAAGWTEAARSLCLKTTGDLLRDELFKDAIGDNIIRMPELEFLLTALRRVILQELALGRFEDRTLVAFITTLIQHCWINEYVWAQSAEESRTLAAMTINSRGLFDGDPREGIQLLTLALYQPMSQIIDPASPAETLKSIKPKSVRDLVSIHLAQVQEERRLAATVQCVTAVEDKTSRRMSAQYEDYPYPRWTCLGRLMSPKEYRELLTGIFGAEQTGFMDGTFEVMVAGCGTGRQAISSAAAYGPNARVMAIDLSVSSLAYAARMAKRFSVTTVTFARGDILELSKNPDFQARFQIIECAGVLHHMADPFAGWRSLAACLAKGGKMLIGIYSAAARKKWLAWKSDPAYPGNTCDEQQLRDYRQILLRKSAAEVGAEFHGIRDIYCTSGFRDLFFNPQEHGHDIPGLATFMEQEGLAFRGFFNRRDFDRLKTRFPGETWPGSLERWADFEAENPQTFAGMYVFWCEKA